MNETSKSGIIFNIQKFSLNDGPGIRTVIFFKGCPLKCKWCANPESQSSKIQILYDKEKCLGCKKCISICPSNAIFNKNDEIFIHDNLCSGCQKCVLNCPGHALKSEGESKTITEILDICLQDKVFYEESGGGITLSGGEALMQPDFSIAILKALKSFNIHTAIETTGFASPEIFDKVTEYIDLLLFDMKHWNEKKHIEGTQVSNKLILENMKRAIASGKKVLPRLPVIPGFNNTLEDAMGFAERLHEVGSNKIQLLPFHQFGEKKYDMLGKGYSFSNIPALHEEDLTKFRQVFIDNGIDAFF
ncbi:MULTISPECIES: glycyl-radical enzyme activating protein [Clostridium]|uniref:glycyl-radical enzyme activating protein n=1 Tax=Clostridium TaxID=1485 RepID=UPI000825EB99|nr:MULTISPECIES: glycyl-radical enzyme activating protein [Clostridium]PJI08158.1 glycyl-radical enzyme activating protein [Clostridium sp. CT7]